LSKNKNCANLRELEVKRRKTMTYWGPPLHNMGLCSRLGGGANAWKHFGPELDPGMRAFHKAPGSEGFWKGDYGGGSR